jgi:DNA-directed RNA polymerase subunit RPC12/RpoP
MKQTFIQTLTDFLGLRTWRYVSCEGCGCRVLFRGRLGDEVYCGACNAPLLGFKRAGVKSVRSAWVDRCSKCGNRLKDKE